MHLDDVSTVLASMSPGHGWPGTRTGLSRVPDIIDLVPGHFCPGSRPLMAMTTLVRVKLENRRQREGIRLRLRPGCGQPKPDANKVSVYEEAISCRSADQAGW